MPWKIAHVARVAAFRCILLRQWTLCLGSYQLRMFCAPKDRAEHSQPMQLPVMPAYKAQWVTANLSWMKSKCNS